MRGNGRKGKIRFGLFFDVMLPRGWSWSPSVLAGKTIPSAGPRIQLLYFFGCCGVCVCVGIKEKPSFLAQGTVPWLTLSTDSGARSPGGPFPSPFWPCLVSPLRGLVLNIGKERKKGTTIRKLGGWDRSSSSGSFQDHQEKQDEEEAGKVPRSSSSVGVFFSSS